MSEIYDYASDGLEVPSASQDKLAKITLTRFNDAVMWQGSELIDGKPLKTVLRECFDQYNGVMSPRDKEIADAIGVDAYVNLTAMKAGLVQSYLVETLVQAGQIPWTVSPTPRPDLSANGEYEAVSRVMEAVQQGYRGDFEALARQIKNSVLDEEYGVAEQRARHMEKLITDQCMEGGWNRAMYGFTTDFAVYPFAVMQGPVPVSKPRLTWSDGALRTKVETFYEFKSISPWDFWYTADSPDTQRGTGIFIRQRWTRQQLLDAIRLPSYNEKAIKDTLKETIRGEYIFRWLSANPDTAPSRALSWDYGSQTIDVLVHYGFFKGSDLREYGVTDVDDAETYNATVTVIGKRTIQAFIHKNPNALTRPVFTASFYKTHDRIPSFSIPQRIRDVERCYLTCLRYLISNAADSSGPIVEADYSRLHKYMSDEDLARIVPNTVYLSSNDMPTQNPALRFYSIPSVMPQYQSLLTYFMDLVDRVSNIPAALHGTAQGTGANRTFRGAAMLQGNAVKAIQAAVGNIDEFVFGPLGELLYNYNLIYSKDDSIKGDCKILARGASGLLQREIDRQNSYEVLQMVASAGQQLAHMPKGAEIIAWALKNVLKQMQVPEELLEAGPQAGPEQAGPEQAGPDEPEASGLSATGTPPEMAGAPG